MVPQMIQKATYLHASHVWSSLYVFIKFTVAFTDNLLVLATSIWDSEQETEGLCLLLLFAPIVAQDVQESENTSILQELH